MGGMSGKEVRDKVDKKSKEKSQQMLDKGYKAVIKQTFDFNKESTDIATQLATDFRTTLLSYYQIINEKLEDFVDRSRTGLNADDQISHLFSYFEPGDELKLEFNSWTYGADGEYLAKKNSNKLKICYVIAVWYPQIALQDIDIDAMKSVLALKKVNQLARRTSTKFKNDDYQVVFNDCFDMTDSPHEVAGSLLNNVEECAPLEDSNQKWFSQQVIHAVGKARKGLSPLERISDKNSKTSVTGNGMHMTVEIFSWVYDKTGANLSEQMQNLIIRFVVAFKYKMDKKLQMDLKIANLLNSKQKHQNKPKIQGGNDYQ